MQWTDRHSFFLAVVCYGLSTIYSLLVFRKGFRRDNWINYGLLATGCAWHTAAMLQRGFSLERCPINNLYEATLFVAWTIVATYLLIGAWPRLQFLGAFVSPVLLALGVFALMPALDVHSPRPTFTGGWSSLHKALILLAYGAFGVGCVGGLMYLTREHQLKRDKRHALWSRLPPIQRLEVTIGQSLAAGFALLTAGLGASAIYLRQTRGVYFSGDALLVYSLLVWMWYLGLLVARWHFSQRGRRFAWGAIGSFVFVILTFWGVYLLSGLHRS